MLSLSKLKTFWASWQPALARNLATFGFVVVAFYTAAWALQAGLHFGSFLLGFAGAVGALFLHFKNESEEKLQASTQLRNDRPEGWSEMLAERHQAELECTRMTTKRAEMECRRLAREIEEGERYDPPDQ